MVTKRKRQSLKLINRWKREYIYSMFIFLTENQGFTDDDAWKEIEEYIKKTPDIDYFNF